MKKRYRFIALLALAGFILAGCDTSSPLNEEALALEQTGAGTLNAAKQSASSSSTVVVSGDNIGVDWFFHDDGIPTGIGEFVTGPDTPPLGVGSTRLALDATGRSVLATGLYAGTRLDALTELSYDTYRNSADPGNLLAITLQFDIDYDLTDANTSWQGRLVFEPYFTIGAGNVPQGLWQTWSPLSGNWWASGAPGNTLCPQSSPCSFATVLANWPDAGLRVDVGALSLKAGGPWPGFDGNADKLTIGTTVGTTTYDFEPFRTPATKDDCKNGGWQSLFRADGSPFKNQGDCIQYVNTGK